MRRHDEDIPIPSGAYPIGGSLAAEDVEQLAAVLDQGRPDDRPPVSKGFIAILALGLFGAYIAFVTPIAISLAIQVKAIAPDNESYLGLVLGVGSLAALVVGPLGGQLSDRTRSRFGRRRPWIFFGTLLGLVGLGIMASSTTIFVLAVGWVVAQIGWSQAVSTFLIVQADKLPESQRGRVGAITGFATMIAPVFGAVLGGLFATQPFVMFLLPGAIALLLVLVFLGFYKDADSRGLLFDDKLTVRVALSKYVYNPRRYPDFSWNWLGRFLFFFGLTLSTSFTAYLYAQRLDLPVTEIGATVATVGGIGILGTIGGVFFGGFLSDKLRRRKVFVLGSGILFALGALVQVFSTDFAILIVGAVLCNISIGVFSAVDQALILDVLPERETEAGRFMNITAFSTQISQAVAPIAGAGLLALTAEGGESNYTMVYIAAALFTIAGGFIVLRVKSVR
ncbi:MFS transporter [Herbiconiux liangxiaofengii]|uniref:MFS transporter n=1 Tax=Herbiconiux liangxiaofengii TaxID=3342795 RepID=UPI0035B87424